MRLFILYVGTYISRSNRYYYNKIVIVARPHNKLSYITLQSLSSDVLVRRTLNTSYYTVRLTQNTYYICVAYRYPINNYYCHNVFEPNRIRVNHSRLRHNNIIIHNKIRSSKLIHTIFIGENAYKNN